MVSVVKSKNDCKARLRERGGETSKKINTVTGKIVKWANRTKREKLFVNEWMNGSLLSCFSSLGFIDEFTPHKALLMDGQQDE